MELLNRFGRKLKMMIPGNSMDIMPPKEKMKQMMPIKNIPHPENEGWREFIPKDKKKKNNNSGTQYV